MRPIENKWKTCILEVLGDNFSDMIHVLTDDVEGDVLVGGGRLPEVHPAYVVARVKPPHARNAENGRHGGDAKVRAVSKGVWLGPEVGPPDAVQAGLAGAGVVAVDAKKKKRLC